MEYEIQKKCFENPYKIDEINTYYIFYITISKDIIENYEANVVGYIIYLDSLDVYEIVEIGILKEYRNKGYGYYLLSNTVNKFSKNIFLEVNENNKAAIKIYEKAFFNKINIRKNYYGKDSAYIMVRSVDDRRF